ncbi:TonB-dependent receptor [bacterium]|nr:TonB-dependent receptor [candidate division CSSED10-310 bacterium]
MTISHIAEKTIFTGIVAVLLLISVPGADALNSSTIKIITQDDVGNRLPGVEIHFTNQSGPTPAVFRTDVNGELLLTHVHGGIYGITALRNGFHPVRIDRFDINVDSMLILTVRLLHKLLNPDDAEKPDSYTLRENYYPSISRIMKSPMNRIARPADLREFLERSTLFFIDADLNPVLVGSRTPDSRLYIDGIPLLNPLNKQPFFYPPVAFIDQTKIMVSGIHACSDAPAGCSIELISRDSGESSFSSCISVSSNLFNNTRIDRADSAAAFRYWNDRTGQDIPFPSESPSIRNDTVQFSFSANSRPVNGQLAGYWRKSDTLPSSDYINEDAYEDANIWMSAGSDPSANLSFKLIGGFQQTWMYLDNPLLLRGFNPYLDRDQKLFGALALGYQQRESSFYRLCLSHQAADDQSGPAMNSNKFKPYKDCRFDPNPPVDVPFFSSGESVLSRIQVDHLRNYSNHSTSLGGAYQWFHCDWNDMVHDVFDEPGNGCPTVSSRVLDRGDWEFSLWGTDRWFPTDLLELTVAIRWDRFHYLTRADYISPRFVAGYRIKNIRFHAGVERVVEPYGFVYLFQSAPDSPSMLDLSGKAGAETGLRWFGGCETCFKSRFKGRLDFYYSLLINPLELVSGLWEDNTRFYAPVVSDREKKCGIILNTSYEMASWLHLNLLYSWNSTQRKWPENMPLTTLDFRLEDRFFRPSFQAFPEDGVTADLGVAHCVLISSVARLQYLWEMELQLDCSYYSGKPYTRLRPDEQPEDPISPERLNDQIGPAWSRFDLSLSKTHRFSNSLSIGVIIGVRNLFNSLQNPPVDPRTGEATFEPYQLDSGQPRAVIAGCQFSF